MGEYLAHFHPTVGSSGTTWKPLPAASDPAEQGQCFLIASESRGCEHALPTSLTQALCCCTVGKAWGPNCEPCPKGDTGESRGGGRVGAGGQTGEFPLPAKLNVFLSL